MEHLINNFSETQIKFTAKTMHNDIHKLLLFRDKNVKDIIFNSYEDYEKYFKNLLIRFNGLNSLLGYPELMIKFMSVLHAAFIESKKEDFNYIEYRRLIFDAHGLLTQMFGEVR